MAYRDKEAELACAQEEEARWRRRERASSQALAAVGAAVDAVANSRSSQARMLTYADVCGG